MFGVIKNWRTYPFDVSRYNDLDDIKQGFMSLRYAIAKQWDTIVLSGIKTGHISFRAGEFTGTMSVRDLCTV